MADGADATERVPPVLVALDEASGYAYVITAYEPDLEHFEPDFRMRREQ